MSCSTLNKLKPGVGVAARATKGAHSTRANASRADGARIILFIFLSPCGWSPGSSRVFRVNLSILEEATPVPPSQQFFAVRILWKRGLGGADAQVPETEQKEQSTISPTPT